MHTSINGSSVTAGSRMVLKDETGKRIVADVEHIDATGTHVLAQVVRPLRHRDKVVQMVIIDGVNRNFVRLG